jgi:hypothetical protein
MITLRRTVAAVTVALAVTTLLVLRPEGADSAACTTTVSSASAAASAVNAAAAGATVCLADGSYGRLTFNVSKASPGVTIRAEHAGAATVAGATLTGANLTLADLAITDEIDIMPGSSGMTISHNRITGGYLGVNLSSDTTAISDTSIVGNQFVGPFGEDSIRANRYHDANGDGIGLLVEGNEITGVRENGNHSDCLQAVWVGDGLYFRKNYLHDNRCQGFFIKDQASTVTNVVAEDNLFLRNDAACAQAGCGQPSVFQLFGPMTGLIVRRNTIWTPGGESPTTLRDPGWGSVTIDSNVIYRPWSDTTAPFGSGYSATNNIAGKTPEGTWPSTGFSVVAAPSFADPAHDDYRTNDGRGVDWASADQHYGPGGTTTTPPPPPPPPPPTDTTPPDTSISSGPSGSTSATSASFAFASTEAGSSLACKLDAGAWAACTSPKAYTGLAVGGHTFSVRATDVAGNTDQSPATRTWTIAAGSSAGDTTAPQTTITSGPTGPTNDDTPTIAFGSNEAGTTFTCRADTGAWAACASPWTTPLLGDGGHSVSVRARDAAGNTDATPAVRSFTIDTDAPTTRITSAPRALANSSDAAISFAVDDRGATSQCRLDDGAWVACSSPYRVSGLGDGAHAVTIRSRDAAGNVEAPGASVSWTVQLTPDTGAPPPSSPTPAGAPPTARLAAPVISGRLLRLAATARDDHGIVRVDFWIDGVRVARDKTAPYKARISAGRLSPGLHTVSVRAFDAAGQAASAAATARVRHVAGRGSSLSWAPVLQATRLTGVSNGDGVLHVTGRTAPNGVVRVSLTRCASSSPAVIDRFSLRADSEGRLDLAYRGSGACLLRLAPRTS